MQGEMVHVRMPLETRVSLPALNICPLFTILVGMKGKEMPGFVMSSRSRCNYARAFECELTNASV